MRGVFHPHDDLRLWSWTLVRRAAGHFPTPSITDGKTGFPHEGKNSGGQLADHTNPSFMRIVALFHFGVLL